MLDATLDLLPEPAAAGTARRWASELLLDPLGRDAADTVELVLTELVQNAVFHASTPMRVVLHSDGEQVCVGVVDRSPVLPSSGLTDVEAMSGRGLMMVAAVASEWGAEPREDGKVVWARVPARPAAGAGEEEEPDLEALLGRWADDGGTEEPVGGTPLVVPGLPTAAMLAVKTHNDDVVRELTLVAMAGPEALQGTPEAVAELARSAREVLSTFAAGRKQIRDQVLAAVRGGAAEFDLRLVLDERTLAVLDDYLDVLERADGWAVRGVLLSEPPDDEVVAVRRDYLTRLIAAARGR
ncbi:ATP-binding protein [Aquipuribacter sp. SD81]|uniref:ATP-binding protein n=1 Tax=Aquipuribacter sp. SD81 TaxID=3127703 RepID=UPI00301A5029